jgi:hypothetical protein
LGETQVVGRTFAVDWGRFDDFLLLMKNLGFGNSRIDQKKYIFPQINEFN